MLLASTLAGTRFLLAPATSFAAATFSSLMPLRHRGGLWWVRATLTSSFSGGLDLDAVRTEIETRGMDFTVEQASGWGEFRPLARLRLQHVDPSSDDIAFDPVLHTHDEVRLAPGWLADFRRAAYRRSREGRGAQ